MGSFVWQVRKTLKNEDKGKKVLKDCEDKQAITNYWINFSR